MQAKFGVICRVWFFCVCAYCLVSWMLVLCKTYSCPVWETSTTLPKRLKIAVISFFLMGKHILLKSYTKSLAQCWTTLTLISDQKIYLKALTNLFLCYEFLGFLVIIFSLLYIFKQSWMMSRTQQVWTIVLLFPLVQMYVILLCHWWFYFSETWCVF